MPTSNGDKAIVLMFPKYGRMALKRVSCIQLGRKRERKRKRGREIKQENETSTCQVAVYVTNDGG